MPRVFFCLALLPCLFLLAYPSTDVAPSDHLTVQSSVFLTSCLSLPNPPSCFSIPAVVLALVRYCSKPMRGFYLPCMGQGKETSRWKSTRFSLWRSSPPQENQLRSQGSTVSLAQKAVTRLFFGRLWGSIRPCRRGRLDHVLPCLQPNQEDLHR